MSEVDGSVSWRRLFEQARDRLSAAGFESAAVDARRLIEEAAGFEPGEFVAMVDDPALKRGVAHLDHMLERRLVGEPLQYVIGSWGFRRLDLAVDSRVLIPRPETEGVVEVALGELAMIDRARAQETSIADRRLLVADLGTGSGCIGLSIAVENTRTQVICTDNSADALSVARANTTGIGRPATRVEIRQGDWFDALPTQALGKFDLIISNPPYVAQDESLPPVVADWEPAQALFGGPSGFDFAALLIAGVNRWLRPGGAVVLELGESQLARAAELARGQGLVDVSIHRDLAGRDRTLVARKPTLGGSE